MTLGPIRVASYDFDLQHLTLTRDGTVVSLGRREGAILRTLLEQRGAVVTKQELMDAAWPGLAREESNLSVQIARLRRRLGPGLIRTIGRVGYQLVPAPAPRPSGRFDGIVGRSVTIRPFAVVGVNAGLEGVAQQIAEDLLVGLVRFPALTVIARSAERASRYVIEGSVGTVHGALRSGVRLVDSHSGAILWAHTFSATSGSLAEACDELAPRIVAAIDTEALTAEINRSQRERPGSADTYDLYLRAEHLLRSSSMHDNAQASALIEAAVAREPENVAYLAVACAAIHNRIPMGWPALTPDDAKRAHDYALRGLKLVRNDADAIALFGFSLLMTGDRDFGYATTQRAAALNPNSVLVMNLAGQANLHWGDIDQCEEQMHHAYRLNPSDPGQRYVWGGLARIALIRGHVVKAAAMARTALGFNQYYNPIHWTLIATAAHLGRPDEAKRHLARFKANNPGVTLSSIIHGRPSVDSRNASLLEGLEAAGLS